MNLYLANGTYVGTQAEARKLDKGFKPVTVPVDKEGLIAYLNALVTRRAVTPSPAEPSQQEKDRITSADWPADMHPMLGRDQRMAAAPEGRDMSASAVLSRLDGPTNIDAMCETICTSSGYPLKRFAASVACAFTRLEQGVR